MRKMILLLLLAAVTLFLVSCGDRVGNDTPAAAPETVQEVSATPVPSETATPTPTPIPSPTEKPRYDDPKLQALSECSPYELYSQSMLIASEEQKEKLQAIGDNKYFGCWAEAYTREIKIIMGLIPEDTPYLTVEALKQMIPEIEARGWMNEFYDNVWLVRDYINEFGYVPDMDGGSGIASIRYSVDAEHTGYIELNSVGGIRYHNIADDTTVDLCIPPYITQ